MTAWTPLSVAMLAVLLALTSSGAALFATIAPRVLRSVALPLFGVAGACALVAGVWALASASAPVAAELPFGLPWLPWHVRLDALAGFFLGIIGVVSLAVGIYGSAYVRSFESGSGSLAMLGGFTGVFLAAMLLVVLADDAFLFMVAWELMSLSSYFLVAFHHEHAANRRAAFLYLLMAHVGGLAILLGFGVLASFGDGFTFEQMRTAATSPLWTSLAFVLAFFGFGMKAGLVPVHVWLPEAHPVAPSHVSALMSGVMLKVAVYGFIRFVFDLIGNLEWQWGVVLLGIGSLSALFGALAAMMESDLKRLLAYSSVENVGIIFLALGLSMIFFGTGHLVLGCLGLVAALYHALNHALFKSLLFLSAGAIHHSSHQQDLDQMGGLLRRMPWTGGFFLIGCLSISALPPFNGFVSEWLIFQTALQAWELEGGILRSLLPIATSMLALTGALVAATFVKVYGVAFLGRARSRQSRRARPVPRAMRAGQALLAGTCLLVGIFPFVALEGITRITAQIVDVRLPETTQQGWLWLIPLLPETASYSALWVACLLLLVGVATAAIVQPSTVRRVKRRDPWDCGFAPPTPRMQYSATAFAQPLRRVFGVIFRIDEHVDDGATEQAHYRLSIVDRAWAAVYLPIAGLVDSASRRILVLQSGNVRAYLGWTLATLILLLWIVS